MGTRQSNACDVGVYEVASREQISIPKAKPRSCDEEKYRIQDWIASTRSCSLAFAGADSPAGKSQFEFAVGPACHSFVHACVGPTAAMNLVETQALINFYVQKGFNRHVQTLCKDVLKKRGSEPALLFWRAFAIGQEGMAHLGSLCNAHALSFSLWLTHDSPSSISAACARFARRRHSRARRPAGQARRGPRRRVQPRAAAQGSQTQGYVLTRLLVWPLFVRSHAHKIYIISFNF